MVGALWTYTHISEYKARRKLYIVLKVHLASRTRLLSWAVRRSPRTRIRVERLINKIYYCQSLELWVWRFPKVLFFDKRIGFVCIHIRIHANVVVAWNGIGQVLPFSTLLKNMVRDKIPSTSTKPFEECQMYILHFCHSFTTEHFITFGRCFSVGAHATPIYVEQVLLPWLFYFYDWQNIWHVRC